MSELVDADLTAKENAFYSRQEYWDERYRRDASESFEWFCGAEHLEPVLRKSLRVQPRSASASASASSSSELAPAVTAASSGEAAAGSDAEGDVPARLLHVGCGNSLLGMQMLRSGMAKCVVNTDYSTVCLDKMRVQCGESEQLQWVFDDCMKSSFADGEFDAIVDKGTMDAVLAERGDKWTPDDATWDAMRQFTREMYRLLRPGGVLLEITFGQPHFRSRFLKLDGLDWDLTVHTIEKGFHYFVYELRKRAAAPASASASESE